MRLLEALDLLDPELDGGIGSGQLPGCGGGAGGGLVGDPRVLPHGLVQHRDIGLTRPGVEVQRCGVLHPHIVIGVPDDACGEILQQGLVPAVPGYQVQA